ncbi:MAG: XTP/dITP diphosphatase [Desulfobacterales bacterium]|nr:XTP/dITP diphosphatase [Desulfobacterales bacterium]
MNEIKIVIATRNSGKLKEFKEILSDFQIKLNNLDDFPPILEVEEDGNTFEENAIKKAVYTAEKLGVSAISDDSGLVVEALNGAPGVYSSRYAGENATDYEKCLKLLNEMKDKANRKAFFECVIAIALPTGKFLTYSGRCEGLIGYETIGSLGFGYDPLFYYPKLKKTFGELTGMEKGEVSHRGRALLKVKNDFDKILNWMESNLCL